MAELHQLQVKITADASGVRAGMQQGVAAVTAGTKQMESAAGSVRSAFSSLIPALSVGALVAFGKRAIDATGHLNDMADRIGFAASTLSALEPALAATGSSVDDFAASMNLMNNMIGEAAKGANQAAVKAFDDLGLSVRKLQQLSPEEQFYQIVTALSSLDSQYKQTEAGRNIFGRGFASLIPLIKDANGNLEGHVQTLKDTRDALSDETIKRIDDFGDHLSDAGIKAKNSFIEAFAEILKVGEYVAAHLPTGEEMKNARLSNYGIADTSRSLSAEELYAMRAKARGFATEVTFAKPKAPSAKGGNAGLLKAAKPEGDAVRDYLQKQRDSLRELQLPEPQRSAQKAEDGLRLVALKDSKKLTQEMIAETRSLAVAQREITDPNPINEYIAKLREEQDVYQADEKTQAGLKAYYDLVNQTKKDGIVISEQEKQQIEGLATANEELKKKTEESQQAAKKMRDDLTDGLTDIILHFDSATDSAKKFFDEIAAQILKKNVTSPIADGLSGFLGNLFKGTQAAAPSADFIGPMPASGGLSGIGAMLGFAGGGSPPVGVPSIVGERGPEIFVPKSAGTIIPNHALGGNTVTVRQTFHMSPGLQGTVEAEVRRAAPGIAAAAKAAVFQSIEKGGRESQLVNRRG